jgi:hypothetical protein
MIQVHRVIMKRLSAILLLLILVILPGCNLLILGGGLVAGWYGVPAIQQIRASRQAKPADDGSAKIGLFSPCRPFTPYGAIDRNFEYEDFRRKGPGYSFTLVNRNIEPLYNFQVIVYGLNVKDEVIYKRDFHVSSIGGKGKVTRLLPGYNMAIYRVEAAVFQNPGARQDLGGP